jgi:hypothetical protein
MEHERDCEQQVVVGDLEARLQVAEHALREIQDLRSDAHQYARQVYSIAYAALNPEGRMMPSSGFARNEARRNDLAGNDLAPSCPHCGDLSTDGAKWCGSCDTWLLDRGPLASELHERQQRRRATSKAALLSGDAAQLREDPSTRKGKAI